MIYIGILSHADEQDVTAEQIGQHVSGTEGYPGGPPPDEGCPWHSPPPSGSPTMVGQQRLVGA